LRQREATFSTLAGPWAALSGLRVRGYEIHHGQTAEHAAMAAAGDRATAVMVDDLAWQNGAGQVLGLYLHGLFEDPGALQALFGVEARTLDAVFDGLADHIDSHFEPGVLRSLIE
jgi:adenosylcobyric acid synthase